jgi:hypothetical protein
MKPVQGKYHVGYLLCRPCYVKALCFGLCARCGDLPQFGEQGCLPTTSSYCVCSSHQFATEYDAFAPMESSDVCAMCKKEKPDNKNLCYPCQDAYMLKGLCRRCPTKEHPERRTRRYYSVHSMNIPCMRPTRPLKMFPKNPMSMFEINNGQRQLMEY